MSQSVIRPIWHCKSKVFCECRIILSLGATKPKMFVDNWSELCNFYLSLNIAALIERKLERFIKKYGSLFLFFSIS